jgi:hypothetical protein
MVKCSTNPYPGLLFNIYNRITHSEYWIITCLIYELEEVKTLTPYITFPQISHVSNYRCITQLTPTTDTGSALIRYTTVTVYKTAFENRHMSYFYYIHTLPYNFLTYFSTSMPVMKYNSQWHDKLANNNKKIFMPPKYRNIHS